MTVYLVLKDVDYRSLLTYINRKAGSVYGLLNIGKPDRLVVRLINGAESFLIRKIEEVCLKRGVALTLGSIRAELIDADTIRLSVGVDRVGVTSAADLLKPLIEKSPDLSFLTETLEKYPEAFESCVSGFLDSIDEAGKDRLMVSAVNAYSEKIIGAAAAFARENGLVFTIASLQAV